MASILRLCSLACLLLTASVAHAQPAPDFFKGKAMHFTVVYEPGGTYDIYSRLVITHMPRHIPGEPTMVVQYMPGAGGLSAPCNLMSSAAQDGTEIGILPRDSRSTSVLRPEAAKYDARRFNWIGRLSSYAA